MWQSFFSVPPHETPRERWLGYGAALVAVAIVSGVIGLVHAFAQIANISILYLIAVLVISSRFGRGPAIIASFAAFFAFNWFFDNFIRIADWEASARRVVGLRAAFAESDRHGAAARDPAA